MALEIERKFLTLDESYKRMAESVCEIRQGYLSRDPATTIRIRTRNDLAFLTIKTKNEGCVRQEFEYEIPLPDANKLLAICSGTIIEKTRYLVPYGSFTWEIDAFHGALEGITLAEIELPETDTTFPLPPFIGKEVTGIPEYYNSNIHLLARR